jgi:type II secretory pathway pseudopilin PulG
MRTPRRQGRDPQAGITLMELLISMIILSIVTTMLIGAWISLQRAYASTSAKNKATATARDALDRISSELRTAQGPIYNASPSPTTSSPFYLTQAPPHYVCDAYDCVFYSAYNNPSAALYSGPVGRSQLKLTAIWLDQSGSQPQKTLWWERDTSGNGLGAPGNRKIKLATNVVNAALTKPIFTYTLRTTSPPYQNVTTLPLGTTDAANLAWVGVDLIVDANLSHTPTYIDLKTTVEPRNLGSQ